MEMSNRDLVVTENITLDGVIEATEGWFARPATIPRSISRTSKRRCGSNARPLMRCFSGRVTFEQMRGYWPLQTDDTTGITDYLNNVSKYVVSNTLQDPEWKRTTVLRGALIDEIQALKSKPGRDIVTTGSMTMVLDLISAGLVEEYRLFVYPVVLGPRPAFVSGRDRSPKTAARGDPALSLGPGAPALPDGLKAPSAPRERPLR